ncbi:MAG: manganese catalase family protein [Chitinophagaceae bacterium]|nr:manganese catalase family protein [Chitinophagaceae bacterium]
MFYHVKDLQYNVRVSKPDPKFATLLLEQFGGANGELAAALRYFGQAFAAKAPHPDKYDMLMDIATEEFSHLEIVGATIQLLLTGVNGDLKDAAEQSEIMQLMNGRAAKEQVIHDGICAAPQFLVASGGSPAYTNSQGVPWTASFINGDIQGDLTSDLRSDMGAETRAKMVYEYLMQFTDDPYIKQTLSFLMTREVAHFQMFEAALSTIQPNFPPGTMQGDPRYSNLYFNMSSGNDFRGPWNQGVSTQMQEPMQYIDDPVQHILTTNGLLNAEEAESARSFEEIDELNRTLGKQRRDLVDKATEPTNGILQWNDPERELMMQDEVLRQNAIPVEKDANVTIDESKSTQE